MLEEIDIYIKDRFTPEMCGSVSRLFEILESLTEDDYQMHYMSILMEDGNQEPLPSEERFTNLMFDNARYILKQHSIVAAEDVPIYELLDLIEGVLALDKYENKQAIIDQIEGAEDTIDALAGVLQFTTQMDQTKIYAIVEECDPMLIKRLRTLCEGDSIEEDPTTTENNAIVTTLKKLRDFIQYPEAKGFELIRAGVPIGVSFSNYLRHYTDVLKGKDIPIMAKELTVLLYMSGDTHASPLVSFKEMSNTLFEDLSIVTKMEIELTNLMSAFESTFNPRNQKESSNA